MKHLKHFEAYNVESLNENIFVVNIDELYKAVEKFVDSFSYDKRDITLEKNGDSVQFIIKKNITQYNLDEYYNMDNKEITEKLKGQCIFLDRQFSKFKSFTEKGLRGFSELFKKQLHYVTVNTTNEIRIVKHDNKTGNYRDTKVNVWIINETGATDTNMNKQQYIERYGSDELNIETIIVNISLNESNESND